MIGLDILPGLLFSNIKSEFNDDITSIAMRDELWKSISWTRRMYVAWKYFLLLRRQKIWITEPYLKNMIYILQIFSFHFKIHMCST